MCFAACLDLVLVADDDNSMYVTSAKAQCVRAGGRACGCMFVLVIARLQGGSRGSMVVAFLRVYYVRLYADI